MDAPPWTARYEPGVPVDLPPVAGPLHSILLAAAAESPRRPALACHNRVVRYADLEALAGRVARALARDGVVPGDRVLLALPPGLPFVAAAVGTLRLGAVVAPIDPSHPDLAAEARAVAPRLALASSSAAGAVSEAGCAVVEVDPRDLLTPFMRLLLRLGSPGVRPPRRPPAGGARTAPAPVRWRAWLSGKGAVPRPEVDADAPALMARRSGGAWVYSHRHLSAAAHALRSWLPDAVPGDETWLVLAPPHEPLGFVASLGVAPLLRARLALVPTRRALDELAALRYLRPSYVVSDSEAVGRMLPELDLHPRDARSVRAWLVGDALEPGLAGWFAESTGLQACQGLVLPGAAGLVACNPVNGRRGDGSVGLPLPGMRARVVDPRGRELPPGAPGCLEIAGPAVAAHGWLASGLTARADEDGFIYTQHARRPAPAGGPRLWSRPASMRPGTAVERRSRT